MANPMARVPSDHVDYNLQAQAKARWDSDTNNNTPYPTVSRKKLHELAVIALSNTHDLLKTHSDYTSTWYKLTSDHSNNGIGGIGNDRYRVHLLSGKAYSLIKGLCWVLGTVTLKWPDAATEADAKELFELYLAREVANFRLDEFVADGGTRSGSTEEDDYNDLGSAITTHFGTM